MQPLNLSFPRNRVPPVSGMEVLLLWDWPMSSSSTIICTLFGNIFILLVCPLAQYLRSFFLSTHVILFFFYIQKFSLPSFGRLSHGHIVPHVIIILFVWFLHVGVGAADHVAVFQTNVNPVRLENMERAALQLDYGEISWRRSKRKRCDWPAVCSAGWDPDFVNSWTRGRRQLDRSDWSPWGRSTASFQGWTRLDGSPGQWQEGVRGPSLGHKAMQRRKQWTYQGVFGTAFADAHLLCRSLEVCADLQIFQTSFIWLHGHVMSDGGRIKWKMFRWPVMWLSCCDFNETMKVVSTSPSVPVGLRRRRTLWTHLSCISPQLQLFLHRFPALRSFAECRWLGSPTSRPSESDERTVKWGQSNQMQAKVKRWQTRERSHLPGTFWCSLKLEQRANCHEGKCSPFP